MEPVEADMPTESWHWTMHVRAWPAVGSTCRFVDASSAKDHCSRTHHTLRPLVDAKPWRSEPGVRNGANLNTVRFSRSTDWLRNHRLGADVNHRCGLGLATNVLRNHLVVASVLEFRRREADRVRISDIGELKLRQFLAATLGTTYFGHFVVGPGGSIVEEPVDLRARICHQQAVDLHLFALVDSVFRLEWSDELRRIREAAVA